MVLLVLDGKIQEPPHMSSPCLFVAYFLGQDTGGGGTQYNAGNQGNSVCPSSEMGAH